MPLSAASVRGTKASLFVVEDGVARARTVSVLGESNGKVYLDPELKPGSQIVTDGRALLNDGDRVQGGLESVSLRAATSPSPTVVGRAP
jgi:hypothetical protein